jgi:sulfide dehydrogenase cytochrome subunit
MGAARSFIAVAAVAIWSGWAAGAVGASPEPPLGASSCSGCHAAKAGVDTAVPRLAGRKAADLVAEMRAFKSGEKPSTVMARIAKGLTDAEIEAIADWYAQQK